MLTHHWLMIIVAVLVGYVLARFYPNLGHMVGLP